MIELDTSGGTIDTSDNLNMFEGYQKVFIVNGANLKVADFINTKFSTADILPPTEGEHAAPQKGTILTGGTSNATMIVDYCNAVNGAALVYGSVLTGTFDEAAEVLTGQNATGTVKAVSFTLDALPTVKPHWYDWTPMNNDTATYGTMPTKAYLGCLYRGRCVISGDPDHPQQWYMSRQANPWDFAYVANDAQSPVAGNNADAGEIGDIIRALIPYKDDFLIFGCASTMWMLRGDPACGGSLDELDLTVGIYGAQSWCFDGASNLYFWGTGGIYRVPITNGSPGALENITQLALPDIVKDELVDPSLYRITLAYDRIRMGILVCITLLSDGTNSNYWYDLRVEGFFPETYPEQCGAYSLYHYAATDSEYQDLLVGCKDGYIRKFDETKKDDDIGPTDIAISSHVTLPIIKLGEDDIEGKLKSLTVVTAGGSAGGSFGDTDSVDYEYHVASDAETVLEYILDGATAKESGTLSGTGKKSRIRKRVRGQYLGIKLENTNDTETWAIERISGEIQPGGKE